MQSRIAGLEQKIKVGRHHTGDSPSGRKIEQHPMGVEFHVWLRSDGICHRCANIRNLEFLFKQSEHPVRGDKATNPRHRIEGERPLQQDAGAAILRCAQALNRLARETSKAWEACLFLAYTRATKENYLAGVARDEKFVRNVWSARNESHGPTFYYMMPSNFPPCALVITKLASRTAAYGS